MKAFVRPWVVLLGVLSASPSMAAAPYVPPQLEAWRAWVLERHPDQACPPVHSDASVRPCVWIDRLDVRAGADGARFDLDVEIFASSDVVLPGDASRWPVDVMVDGRPAIVTRRDERPRVRLDAGRHAIAGGIDWTRMPESLPVPRNHGLLTLVVDGKPVTNALVEGDVLWLGRTAAAGAPAANDSLEARVFRRLADGIPVVLDTTVDVSVAGSNRIVTLGRAVPEGFVVTRIASPLPARVEPDGQLRVQVEPGDWRVVVSARAQAPVNAFRASPAGEHWPKQEIWGFAADRALRVVMVEGAPGVDLSQTKAPFQDLPGFALGSDDELRLVEQFRGDPNPSPNEFTVSRNAWLAFDGGRVVVQDVLDAAVQRPSRLTADFVPGRVTIDGVPQLITAIGGAESGIELPQGQHRIEAVSEFPRAEFDVVPGWHVDAASLATTLNLPPGWRLVATRGVDHAPEAWLAQWNVWNLFLVVVTIAVAARLLGALGATLVGVALVLVYHEPGAPTFAWLVMLVLLAGVRVSRAGWFRRILNVAYFLVLALTLVACVVFAVDGFRKAIYPQLERPGAVPIAMPAYEMPVPAQEMMRMESRGVVSDAASPAALVRSRPEAKAADELYPADLKVQTGPAVPRWTWTTVTLGWDGPVTAGQPFGLTLMPPWLTRTLYVAGPVLLLLVLGLFTLANVPTLPRLPPAIARFVRRAPATAATALVAWVVAGSMTAPDARAAELPDAGLLGELERRLTAPPECMPGCAGVERVTIALDERRLRVEVAVHADVASAVPLPADDGHWLPEDVRSDGRDVALRRDDGGQLFVALPAGRTIVVLEGTVATLDRFELPFPLPPGRLALEVSGWQVFGLDEGQLRGRALQFAREARSEATHEGASLRPEPIAPYYAVERELRFGLEWRATTAVRRVAPDEGVVPFAVPLLAGESVLSGQVTAEGGQVRGVLAAGQNELRYESTLAQADALRLEASALATLNERWTLVPSNLWHLEFEGIPPAKTAVNEAPGPRFHPLPGEVLTVRITRPDAVPGESVTVESVRLDDEPGRRARKTRLTLDLLASQGGEYAVTLPADATVTNITIDGRVEPLPLVAGPVGLPIVPGRQSIVVTWESPQPIATGTRTSVVELSTVARNIDLTLALSADRWPLLVGGPALGPAVMYWGVLVLVILIALALARIPGLPLSTMDAVLVGLGMSLCNLPGTVVVGVWLLVLLARRRAAERLMAGSVATFQLLQILLAVFSIVAVATLAATVPFGLLGAPDMHIAGNESTAYSLRWFQDESAGGIPGAWVVSLPLWVYRVAMLLWSLWLAFAIVRWARWAWESYSAGAAWRKVGRRVVTAPAPDVPPASGN